MQNSQKILSTLCTLLCLCTFATASPHINEEETTTQITIIAPSRSLDFKALDAFEAILTDNDFIVYRPDNLSTPDKSRFGYYANDDIMRTQIVKDALEGPSSVLWSARGGFGAQTVVRNLQKTDFVLKNNKLIIGFSDATVLGLYLMTKGAIFIHGPMYYVEETTPITGIKLGSKTSINTVIDLIKKHTHILSYEISLLNMDSITHSETTVIGGNLSVIQRNLGGLLKDVDFSESLLFLEDTKEDSKRAWDILCGMFDTGRFNDISGILFGDMPLGDEYETETEFLNDFSTHVQAELGRAIPIFKSNQFGHGLENNPIPMGVPAYLQTTSNGKVTLNFNWSRS